MREGNSGLPESMRASCPNLVERLFYEEAWRVDTQASSNGRNFTESLGQSPPNQHGSQWAGDRELWLEEIEPKE
jgi:hypothetical protein